MVQFGMSPENQTDVREMTRGMAAGDDAAYRVFWDKCFDRLYRHLLVKTSGDESLARELAQTVVIRVVRYVKTFENERVFWAWLYQICRTVHVDWLRAHRREFPCHSLEIYAEPAVFEEDADEELLQCLDGSLKQLDASDQELLRLAYFEKLSQRAIAERYETTTKAVESKLARIRGKLRQIVLEHLKAYVLF